MRKQYTLTMDIEVHDVPTSAHTARTTLVAIKAV